MKPKDQKKIEQIFRATLFLVEEKGVAGITVGEIARTAYIATGTLYVYFKSKEELINILFTECRKASVEIYFMNYNENLPFKKGFKSVWLNLLKFRTDHFDKAIYMDQCYHSPFITETTKEITGKLIQPLYKLVERGKAEKQLKDIDNYVMLTFIVGGINEFVKHSNYSDREITDDQIEELFNLCWDGLKFKSIKHK